MQEGGRGTGQWALGGGSGHSALGIRYAGTEWAMGRGDFTTEGTESTEGHKGGRGKWFGRVAAELDSVPRRMELVGNSPETQALIQSHGGVRFWGRGAGGPLWARAECLKRRFSPLFLLA